MCIFSIFRRPIPYFSDPTHLSEGQTLSRVVRRHRRKPRKDVSIALPRPTNLRELQTKWISRNCLRKIWVLTNEPDTEEEDEEQFDTSGLPDYDFGPGRKNFHPPPGGSSGSFASAR